MYAKTPFQKQEGRTMLATLAPACLLCEGTVVQV